MIPVAHIDTDTIVKEILKALASRPQIPIEHQLWDIATIADYLGCAVGHARDRILPLPGFPPAGRGTYDRIVNGEVKPAVTHPKYRAIEVIAWANQYYFNNDGQKKPGRPRKTL